MEDGAVAAVASMSEALPGTGCAKSAITVLAVRGMSSLPIARDIERERRNRQGGTLSLSDATSCPSMCGDGGAGK
jgi:hypothetical protein